MLPQFNLLLQHKQYQKLVLTLPIESRHGLFPDFVNDAHKTILLAHDLHQPSINGPKQTLDAFHIVK